MIRLYGVERGNGSWARVTEGIRGALDQLGLLAGFYDVSRVDVPGDDALDEGYDAACGLCIGPPTAASVIQGRGEHRHRLLMVATNSSWLPAFTMEQASLLVTAFVGTSPWATGVIRGYVPPEMPVLTFPHGVDERFRPLVDAQKYDRFSVLHLASTHAERKGTRELIEGWCMAWRSGGIPKESCLRIVLDGSRGAYAEVIRQAAEGSVSCAETIVVMPRLDLSVEDTVKLYSMHHLVAQPSRAEGFGLVPLEARACGVPVLATACTGHAEHFACELAGLYSQTGRVHVRHYDDARIDDGPGAFAPAIRASDIADGLGYAYRERDKLAERALAHAGQLGRDHSWQVVTERFVAEYGTALGLA
jgi:glycosyltransferase involved in cell wall biosynthesis